MHSKTITRYGRITLKKKKSHTIKREFSKIRSKVVIFFPITTGMVLILAIASPLISLRSNKIVFIIPFKNINEKTAKNKIIFF